MAAERSPDTRLERLSFLSEVSHRLAGAADHEATWKTIAAIALPRPGHWSIVDLVEADGSVGRLPVVHPDAGMQDLARNLGRGWPPASDGNIDLPSLLRSESVHVVGPVTEEFLASVARDDEHLAILRQLGIAATVTVPLLTRGRVLGAITFVSSDPGDAYTDDDQALAEDLASRCALAIEQMRQVEELQKSVLLRDQVLAYVSHDLKNPLGAIVFAASHLLQDAIAPHPNSSGEHRMEVAESILTATEHMQRLITDLLEVAQIGDGGVTIERRLVKPSALVEDVRDTYKSVLAARSLRLVSVVPEGLPVVRADPGRLRQVFENLLENAAKFTPGGGVVTLAAALLDDWIVFSVADTGSGIPDDELPRLFDRFWQARRPGAGSAGLGLTICKGIVEAHRGAIWADSTVGQGSTFHFRIPLEG